MKIGCPDVVISSFVNRNLFTHSHLLVVNFCEVWEWTGKKKWSVWRQTASRCLLCFGGNNLVNWQQSLSDRKIPLLILGQLFDKSIYYPLDILDLMLNSLPLWEKSLPLFFFLMEPPALASQIASNGTISFHFTLLNLPLRRVPVEMILWVTHFGHMLFRKEMFRCLTNSWLGAHLLNGLLLKKFWSMEWY